MRRVAIHLVSIKPVKDANFWSETGPSEGYQWIHAKPWKIKVRDRNMRSLTILILCSSNSLILPSASCSGSKSCSWAGCCEVTSGIDWSFLSFEVGILAVWEPRYIRYPMTQTGEVLSRSLFSYDHAADKVLNCRRPVV